jgi:predicted permease
LNKLWLDAVFALRQLARNPTSTAVGIATLALGFGANTAVFCLVNALLIRPLPVADPSRLVDVAMVLGEPPSPLAVSHPNFEDLRERTAAAFAGMAAHTNISLTLRLHSAGEPEEVRAQMVSGGFFELLGVTAAVGRTFDRREADEEGAHPVAVVSHHFWRGRLGGDPAVVGRALGVNGQEFTIIGVAPEGFYGVLSTYPTDVFVTDAMWRQALPASVRDHYERRTYAACSIVGRLAPGVSLEQAQGAAGAVARQLAAEYPQDNERLGLLVRPLDQARIRPRQRQELVLGAKLLLTGAGLVLLIGCSNLSSLLLARLLSRQREIAVRAAIGAAPGDLVRLLVVESLVLAAVGGAAGLVLAVWLRRLAWALRPVRMPANLDLSFDARVLVFAAGLAVFVGFLIASASVLQVRDRQLSGILKGRSFSTGFILLGTRWSPRNVLVGLQVALCLVSLVGAFLFLRGLLDARRLDLGFEKRDLFVVSLDPSAAGYDEPRGQLLYGRITEAAGAVPGVVSAAVGEIVNLYPVGFLMSQLRVDGRDPDEVYLTQVNTVAPGYFETVGIPLLEGRGVSPVDRSGAPSAVVVNETLARVHWPGESAVGNRLVVAATGEVLEVVGVARDARYKSVDEEPYPYLYRALAQHYSSPVFLHVRTAGDPAVVAPAVRRAIRSIEPGLALTHVWTMEEVVDRALWARRMATILLSVFALLGLLLAMGGLYGTLAFSVRERRQEIALRTALGARRADIHHMIVLQGMRVVTAGLAAGLTAAVVGTALASRLVPDGTADPATFAAASGVLLLAAWVTNSVVARRSAMVDPARCLRGD